LVSSGLSGDNIAPDVHNNVIVWQNSVNDSDRIYKDEGAGPQLVSIGISEVISTPVVYDGIISWSGKENGIPYVHKTQTDILTNTWTGSSNFIWDNSSNWSLGSAPDFCHDVVIPSGSDVIIPSSTFARGYSLTTHKNALFHNNEGGVFDINSN